MKVGWQKSWRDDGLEMKVKEVRLLESIGQEMTQSITLKLFVDKLNNQIIDQLDMLCETKKGKHQLKIILLDRQNKMKLKMKSKAKTVQADGEFVSEVERLGIEYIIR